MATDHSHAGLLFSPHFVNVYFCKTRT